MSLIVHIDDVLQILFCDLQHRCLRVIDIIASAQTCGIRRHDLDRQVSALDLVLLGKEGDPLAGFRIVVIVFYCKLVNLDFFKYSNDCHVSGDDRIAVYFLSGRGVDPLLEPASRLERLIRHR